MAITTKQIRHRHYKYYDHTGHGMAWNTDKRLLWVVHINGKRYPNEKDYGYRADSKQEAIYMALKESDNIFGHLYFGGL